MRHISLVILLTFVSSTLLAEIRIAPSDRVKNYISVKEAPESGTRIVDKLLKGQSATYLSDESHYYKVKLDNGSEGFVHKSWSKKLTTTTNTGELEVHFIDVGQGDATLLTCPNGKSILVDAGSLSGYTSDQVREYMLPLLDRKERKIDTLVITHADRDHYNLIKDTLKNIPVGHTFYVGDHDDYGYGMDDWLIAQSNKTNLPSTYFDPENQKNASIDCGAASVYVLAANIQNNFSHKNTMSIVLMVRYGDFEVVLTGDATKKTENKILERYSSAWLDSDVLKIGHHGSKTTSTTEDWASAIKPQVAVTSSGLRSSYGHPRKEIIQRLEPFTKNDAPSHTISYASGKRSSYFWEDIGNYKEQIYSTVNSGNVIIKTNGAGYTVNTVHHRE
ncbi:MAG: MBL fold metallo-hydrolase [Methylococcales bacterium]